MQTDELSRNRRQGSSWCLLELPQPLLIKCLQTKKSVVHNMLWRCYEVNAASLCLALDAEAAAVMTDVNMISRRR